MGLANLPISNNSDKELFIELEPEGHVFKLKKSDKCTILFQEYKNSESIEEKDYNLELSYETIDKKNYLFVWISSAKKVFINGELELDLFD